MSVPKASTPSSLLNTVSGTTRSAGPSPNRRRNRDVTVSCRMRQTMPAQKLNWPKNAVNAFLSG